MRWAIVVAQHRSLRQAAAALSIRQSTRSRRLQDIEYQMGTVLFERTNGGSVQGGVPVASLFYGPGCYF
ncbi:LysR family transcriptional regulator [Acidithiobacillus sp.]|uniref:helix-turn-helix domain-containing protein n=1 Tax=Acidithiobacillus sp. TaxID=1872118 RepID=UPI003433826E